MIYVRAHAHTLEKILENRCQRKTQNSSPDTKTDQLCCSTRNLASVLRQPSRDFDDVPLRHQLYTLALTHFQTVYRNYFERPELHKLHNRSGELWSPLVALAAFFEEQGGISG